jgi:hypothetical protein
MKRILELIDVTVILHNFLIQERLNGDEHNFYNPDEDNESENNVEDDDDALESDNKLNQGIGDEAPPGRRREQLRAYLSETGIIKTSIEFNMFLD